MTLSHIVHDYWWDFGYQGDEITHIVVETQRGHDDYAAVASFPLSPIDNWAVTEEHVMGLIADLKAGRITEKQASHRYPLPVITRGGRP